MPPTMHESTKHPQRGRRPVSIDRHLKINGSGIPGSLSFHEKYVVCPQIKFSDRPLFQKGSPGCRAGSPAKSVREGVATGAHRLRHPKIYDSGIPDSFPFHKKYVARPPKKFSDRPLFQKGAPGCRAGALQGTLGCRAGALQGTPGCRAGALQRELGAGREAPRK